MKDGLRQKIMIEFLKLRPIRYSYLADGSDENKKAKDTKTSVKITKN